MENKTRIAVIGAGVNGLASAVQILNACLNTEVTIISEKFSPNTTSDAAAGLWGFYFLKANTTDQSRKWAFITLDYLYDLAMGPQAGSVGAELLSGFVGVMPGAEDRGRELRMQYPLPHRALTAQEMKLVPSCSTGYLYTSVQMEAAMYLPYLLNSAKKLGAKVIQKRVNSFQELEDYDIIVNCSGLGARELTGDMEVKPGRGQGTRVAAPWIKHFVVRIHDDDYEDYIIPGPQYVVLGGIFELGSSETAVDKKDQQKIWTGCSEAYPGLKNAKILKPVAGLRPYRPEVRLEEETIKTPRKNLKVIHNYGHGGAGYTLHWGCAMDVVRYVEEYLSNPSAKL